MLRLWALSWQRRGWKTRLLTNRELRKHGSVKAAMKGQKGIFVSPTAINFGLPVPKRGHLPVIRGYPLRPGSIAPRATKFGTKHWESAPVVQFSREFEVLNCGRYI